MPEYFSFLFVSVVTQFVPYMYENVFREIFITTGAISVV